MDAANARFDHILRTQPLKYQLAYTADLEAGPQLRWWAWNPSAPSNQPWLAAVPLSSVVLFAAAAPFGFALLTQLLVARRAACGPIPVGSLVLRITGVGALTPLSMVLFAIPYSPFESTTAQAAVLWTELALLALIAIVSFWRASGPAAADTFGVIEGTVYLGVFLLLWGTSLPAYVDAAHGVTKAGSPIGSLPYASVCAAGALAVVVLAARRRAADQPWLRGVARKNARLAA